MSDPFQPIEKELGVTRDILDVTNKYGIHILFSTKSDSTYDANIDNKLHSFQLSISNVYNLSYHLAEEFYDDLETSEPCECCGDSIWTYTTEL